MVPTVIAHPNAEEEPDTLAMDKVALLDLLHKGWNSGDMDFPRASLQALAQNHPAVPYPCPCLTPSRPCRASPGIGGLDPVGVALGRRGQFLGGAVAVGRSGRRGVSRSAWRRDGEAGGIPLQVLSTEKAWRGNKCYFKTGRYAWPWI